jgi:hypothetical protein
MDGRPSVAEAEGIRTAGPFVIRNSVRSDSLLEQRGFELPVLFGLFPPAGC